MSAILDIYDLTLAYGSIQALKDVNLRIEEGAITAIIGSNGAGKSSILNTICGLRAPASGTVHYHGENVTRVAPHLRTRMGIAQVPEGRRIFGRMTVAENLWIGASGLADRSGLERDFEHALTLFPRLRERLRQHAGTLSGGEQQMLAIGRALMSRPRLLLLDEPSMGLAPQIVDVVFEAIEKVNREGISVILVEQNALRALEIADRAAVLKNGRITLAGTGAELLDDPRVRAAYLGVTQDDEAA